MNAHPFSYDVIKDREKPISLEEIEPVKPCYWCGKLSEWYFCKIEHYAMFQEQVWGVQK